MTMAKWKTAFLPYWSNDADEILKVLSEAGYDGVEWLRFINFMSGDDLKEICAKARAKGMGVPDIMGGVDLIVLKEEERAQRVQFTIDGIEMARDASVPILNMTVGPADWGESPIKLGKDITEGKAWEILTDSFGKVIEILVEQIEHSTSEQQNNNCLCRLEYRDRAEADRCLSKAASV